VLRQKTVINMSKDRLKILAGQRLSHYKSLKKNKDHSHSIIGEQLYSKQTHFIFELLQNAEDEGATIVRISFDRDKLIFKHNGKNFDLDDIEAITSFGNNERKKLKPNAIGRFGIGFKSVFSVTEKPEIKSGEYHFAISNFIIPNLIDSEKSEQTTITLPFKAVKRNQIVSEVENTLTKLDSSYLLFLNNIKSIEIDNWNDQSKNRSIKLKRTSIMGSTLKVFNIDEGENQKNFLLFERSEKIGSKILPIKIAFSIDRKGSRIEFERIDTSPLFAFFATEKETNLPFYIHAPFLTTPPRDNINDDPRNQTLLAALADLMIHSIELLNANKLIDLNTWLVFPCNISFYKNEVYKIFCDSLFRYLLKKQTKILPSERGNFCHVNDALKASSREIQKLITDKEAKKFFGRSDWVTQKINADNYSVIDGWLKQQYKVPTIGLWEFCKKLDDSFFAKRSDDWLKQFYGCIGDEKKLWGVGDRHNPKGPLRETAFIRTSKNKIVKPFDEQGNATVYLPTEGTSNYHFVKQIFLDDKESRKLFKSLNLTKPDLIAEVNEHVIPRIEKTTSVYKGIREDVLKIFRAVRKADNDEEKILIRKLKDISWLPGRNNLSKKISLYKPDEIYFPSRDLITFLSKAPTANFLDQSLFSDHKGKQTARGILDDVGVLFRPRRFYQQDNEIVFENKDAATENYWNGNDIELEGLKEYLRKTIDKKASISLWHFLIKSIDGWQQSGFADTKFIRLLKDTRWLFNKFGQRLKPADITLSELDEAYDSSDSLIDALDFKADEIRNFELEHGGKFLTNDELQKLREEMDELKREVERLRDQYESDVEDETENDLPDLENVDSKELLAAETPFDDNIPENHQTDDYPDFGGGNGGTVTLTGTVPTKRQKKIGVRGEEFVMKLLLETHKGDNQITIDNLNESDKLGVGCDIIVRRNGVAEILIEVKTTEGGYENKFKISEKQWLSALKSHLNKGEPEYHIYCVYYAGGINLQHIVIKDPVDWMMKKKLRFVEQWFNVLIKR
jgi:hypothetical protein